MELEHIHVPSCHISELYFDLREEISTGEYESYDVLCWECWNDQMTEECEFEEGVLQKDKKQFRKK